MAVPLRGGLPGASRLTFCSCTGDEAPRSSRSRRQREAHRACPGPRGCPQKASGL